MLDRTLSINSDVFLRPKQRQPAWAVSVILILIQSICLLLSDAFLWCFLVGAFLCFFFILFILFFDLVCFVLITVFAVFILVFLLFLAEECNCRSEECQYRRDQVDQSPCSARERRCRIDDVDRIRLDSRCRLVRYNFAFTCTVIDNSCRCRYISTAVRTVTAWNDVVIIVIGVISNAVLC